MNIYYLQIAYPMLYKHIALQCVY